MSRILTWAAVAALVAAGAFVGMEGAITASRAIGFVLLGLGIIGLALFARRYWRKQISAGTSSGYPDWMPASQTLRLKVFAGFGGFILAIGLVHLVRILVSP